MQKTKYDLPIFEDDDKADLNNYSRQMANAIEKQIDKFGNPLIFKDAVETKEELSELINIQNGYIYMVSSENKNYIYNGTEWVEYSDGVNLNAYKDEINTQISNINEAINNKVDKVHGKELSTNDFTDEDKQKLDSIESGANKTVVNNTLTSTSTEEALSAGQGKALNDKILELKDVVLYENNAVATGTVTLSETAANFNYLEIFYKDTNGNNEHASVKVFKPNGKNVSLNILSQSKYNVNSLRYATKTVKIEGTTISNLSSIVGYIEDGSFQIYNTSEIAIIRVDGYRG